MSITRSQIARQMYADGGRGYNPNASPSSTTASRDFETQGVSGGQVSYGGSDDDRYIPKVTYPDQVQRTLQNNSLIGKIGNTLKTVGNYAGQRPTTVLGLASGFNPYLLGISYLANKFGPPRSTGYLENVSPSSETANLTPGQRVSGGTIVNGPTTYTGGDNQVLIPPVLAQTPTDIDSTLSDFDIYMQNLTANAPNRFSLSSRFAAAEGGTPRQAYGLGSLVRKITKPIKKILKSDVGKALALYAAGTYLGGSTAFGGSGGSAWQRFKNIDNLKNLATPSGWNFAGTSSSTPALSTVTQTTGADAVTAPFERLNLEAATAAAEAAKPTPSFIDKAITYAKDNPFETIIGTSLAAGALSDEEETSLDELTADRTDESGLKELLARYPELRFQVQKPYQLAANGGRMGYEEGGNIDPADLPMSKEGFPTYEDIETGEEVEYPYENKEMASEPNIDAELFQMYLDAIGSGKIPRSTTFDQYKELMEETASMGPERTMANEGGLMNLGGKEMDLRGGGFVPLGAKEKADDVPARLSKNEFVFTADAVRAAGGGDVDRGADLMYKTMKDLESRVG